MNYFFFCAFWCFLLKLLSLGLSFLLGTLLADRLGLLLVAEALDALFFLVDVALFLGEAFLLGAAFFLVTAFFLTTFFLATTFFAFELDRVVLVDALRLLGDATFLAILLLGAALVFLVGVRLEEADLLVDLLRLRLDLALALGIL